MSVEKTEHVCCDLCGADDAQPVIDLRDRMFRSTSSTFQLVRCRRCGLHYLNPRPTIDEIGKYYLEDYAPFARNGIAARVKSLTVDRDVKLLWHFLRPPARVIDVGCATGDLLQAVRAHGNPNVLGIEPSEHAAERARERWGIDVLNSTLEQACLPDASIDVAILSHTIEHLPSPSTTLSELRRVITPSGALILWLPNVESLAARLLGEWWIGYDAPRHFYGFTPDTLTAVTAPPRFPGPFNHSRMDRPGMVVGITADRTRSNLRCPTRQDARRTASGPYTGAHADFSSGRSDAPSRADSRSCDQPKLVQPLSVRTSRLIDMTSVRLVFFRPDRGAHSSSGLGHRPLKAEITGSNPVCATK